MPAKFKMSRKGVGQLLRSRMIEADMLYRAEKIDAVAEATSPVGGPADPHRGMYKAGWVVTSTSRGGRRRDRAIATVTNTAPHAAWVEWGTEKYAGRHVLLQAAQAGGG